MASSRLASLRGRLNRSVEQWRDTTSRIVRMDGVNEPNRGPMTLLNFHTREDIKKLALGSDADIGGTSTAHLDFEPDEPNNPDSKGKGKFWGDMRLQLSANVRPDLQGKIRTGYAGFRSKPRPTLFGEVTDDISNHEFLALRLRVGGHPRTRNAYFVNIQTDSHVSGELWQHRLYFRKDDSSWEDIFIPFSSFALTSYGEIASGRATLEGDKVRWLGISLLGGNAGVEGPFELGLDTIRAVNREDVTTPPTKSEASDGTPWERGPLL